MNTKAYCLTSLLGLFSATAPVAFAAAEKVAPKEAKGELRVLAAPDHERRVFVRREGEPVEKETVAFLGVEAAPVSATTSAQLALPRGTGLVVNHVVAKSPAAGVLNEHDILLRLDDQILIETRQLSVLIRNHQEGDEVTLTYLRGGQKNTAKVKLGKQEVPKFSATTGASVRAFAFAPGMGGQFELPVVAGPDGEREEMDRVLSLMRRGPGGGEGAVGPGQPPVRIQLDRRGGPGFRAMSVNTGNSNLVFSDEDGSLDLSIKDGVKNLVAKNAQGEQLFSGPVTTPQERAAMPEKVRMRLEKLEGMHDITFRTDGDFKGAETRTIRPRGISWPGVQRSPGSVPPALL